uniref:HDC03402 n=1 Tax=Drosophila melanogaster TaxID=7227 RepID=Q6IH42_DROME|nr:TPA_inf: HDC03402 [Drosophila melanogaster]
MHLKNEVGERGKRQPASRKWSSQVGRSQKTVGDRRLETAEEWSRAKSGGRWPDKEFMIPPDA